MIFRGKTIERCQPQDDSGSLEISATHASASTTAQLSPALGAGLGERGKEFIVIPPHPLSGRRDTFLKKASGQRDVVCDIRNIHLVSAPSP